MNYIPPEAVEGDIEDNELINDVTLKYDVWAFGCICSFLFTGEVPWGTVSENVILPQLRNKMNTFAFKKNLINIKTIISIIEMTTVFDRRDAK